MKIKDFFELMERPLNSINVTLCTGAEFIEMTADKVVEVYGNRIVYGFDFGNNNDMHMATDI